VRHPRGVTLRFDRLESRSHTLSLILFRGGQVEPFVGRVERALAVLGAASVAGRHPADQRINDQVQGDGRGEYAPCRKHRERETIERRKSEDDDDGESQALSGGDQEVAKAVGIGELAARATGVRGASRLTAPTTINSNFRRTSSQR